MRTDPSQSKYHPRPGVESDFTADEVNYCETLLRRLRFLEHQMRANGGVSNGNGGAVFARAESAALVWALKDLGYLPEEDRQIGTRT